MVQGVHVLAKHMHLKVQYSSSISSSYTITGHMILLTRQHGVKSARITDDNSCNRGRGETVDSSTQHVPQRAILSRHYFKDELKLT